MQSIEQYKVGSVNIDKTNSYKFVLQRLIKGYKKISSWLLYGPSNTAMMDIALSFAAHVLGSSGNYDLLNINTDYIGVTEIRSINRFLSVTAAHNGYKVVIVNNITNMSCNAANAILKILEEPPADSIILMINRTIFDINSTIRSRCCRVYCADYNSAGLSEKKVTLYKKMLKFREANTGAVDFTVSSEESVALFQVLVWRLMKIKYGLIKGEIFNYEQLKVDDIDIECLYKQWEWAVKLTDDKSKFHLSEGQVNILLSDDCYKL